MTTQPKGSSAGESSRCQAPDCGLPYLCSECRPVEWRDVDSYELWNELGVFDPEEARSWDMDPANAAEWIRSGTSAFEAHQFNDLGIEAHEAVWWWNKGINGETLWNACFAATRTIALSGVVEELERWVIAGYGLKEYVFMRVRAGEDAQQFDGQDQLVVRLTWDVVKVPTTSCSDHWARLRQAPHWLC